MTSQKSFRRNFGYAYRSGLRDNAMAAAVQLLFGLLIFVITPAQTLFQKTAFNPATDTPEPFNAREEFTCLLSMDLRYGFQNFVIFAFLAFGVLMGITAFKFMTGKKTVNVYYSLGITRSDMFTAKYLSGLTLLGLALLLPLGVSVILNVVAVGASARLFTAAAYFFLGLFAVCAFSYSLTAAVFGSVGTVFEGVLFSWILLLFPKIFISSLETLIDRLVHGAPYGEFFGGGSRESLSERFVSFDPLRWLAGGLSTYYMVNAKGETVGRKPWTTPDFAAAALWLLTAAVLFAAGLLVYRRRRAEIGGFIGKNRALNFIGTFLMGFGGFVFVFSAAQPGRPWLTLLLALGVFALIYAVLDFLLLRSLRDFARGLYKLPVHLGIALAVFIFFFTGYFGVMSRVPAVDKIESARITPAVWLSCPPPVGDGSSFGGDIGIMGQFGATDTPRSAPSGKYETRSDLEKITGIHRLLIQNGRICPKDIRGRADKLYPTKINIVYKLKNGRELRRSYYGPTAEIYARLLDLNGSDAQRKSLEDVFFGPYKTYTPKQLSDMLSGDHVQGEYKFEPALDVYKRALQGGESTAILYNKLLEPAVLNLRPEQRSELLSRLYRDLSSMTGAQLYTPEKTLGFLCLRVPDAVFNAFCPLTSAAEDVVSPDESPDGAPVPDLDFRVSWDFVEPLFTLTPDMTHTLAYLRELGVDDGLRRGDLRFREVRLTRLGDALQDREFVFRGDDTEIGLEFLLRSLPPDEGKQLFSGQICVKDAGLMAQLYESSVVHTLADLENGYIAAFIAEDGHEVILYLRGSAVPETLRKQG